jgi:iron(III) transport system substrate-binding protein
MTKNIILAGALGLLLSGCFVSEEKNKKTADPEVESKEVNVYSHRHYDIDKELFADFEKETGIKVNVIEGEADPLMTRIENEGKNSPCDLLITTDAGRLLQAKKKGLLQSVSSDMLNNIPANLRDPEGEWFGLTMRARIIVTSKKLPAGSISNYEDLAASKWKGKILIRSSDNMYNQSLVAALIAELGYDKALDWAKGLVANMARDPKGGDRDQVLAIAAGEGEIAVVNTYYIGKMLTSDNPEEVKAAENILVIFPNQADRGTHVNISGAGVAKYAPNKKNAIRLLEYLISPSVQKKFADGNFEYPVLPGVEYSEILKSWGTFKMDSLPLSQIGKYQEDALRLFNESGWK